jgi:hypothetical protein
MRRLRIVLIICVIAIGVCATAAYATTVRYAGPKTWLPGYDANTDFDGTQRWQFDEMCNKSEPQGARVTFIDTSGGWHNAVTDSQVCTSTATGTNYNYTKKAYCKNNSAVTYTAYCEADKY